MLTIALLLGLARADSVVCDAVRGPKLRYEEWSKSGGAYPGPGTVQQTWAWTLDGAALYSRVDTYGGEGSGATGDLDWSWDLSSREGERFPAHPPALQVTVRYKADVTVWTRSGRALGETLPEPRATVRMSCAMTREYGVP